MGHWRLLNGARKSCFRVADDATETIENEIDPAYWQTGTPSGELAFAGAAGVTVPM